MAVCELLDELLAREAESTDLIYSRMDEMFRAGQFAEVDKLLADVTPSAWGIVYLLAFISMANTAREHIAYAAFYQRVRAHLERVEPQRVDQLLEGFQ